MSKGYSELGSMLTSIIITMAILFSLFYGIELNGKKGLTNVLGELNSTEESANAIRETPDEVFSITDEPLPVIEYNSGVLKIGSEIKFKELFNIDINGTKYRGDKETEGNFSLVLVDITDSNDISMLSWVKEGEQDETDEIIDLVKYNQKTDTLQFYQAGSYKIQLSLIDKYKRKIKTTIFVPVETLW